MTDVVDLDFEHMLEEIRNLQKETRAKARSTSDKMRYSLQKQFKMTFASSHELGKCSICIKAIQFNKTDSLI